MAQTMSRIFQFANIPGLPRLRYGKAHPRFHPLMAFELLAGLINTMVVELMNFAESGEEVRRHASEKALEGHSSFHHMLLYFAKK